MKSKLYIGACFAAAAACFATTGGVLATAKLGVNPLMTSETKATEVLRKNGFTPVKVGGYGWFDCGVGEDSDVWRTRFTAQNPKGETVTGTVCEGILKGATLRF